MDNAKIRFKRLNKQAHIPTYGSEHAAGADLYACMGDDIWIKPGETVFIRTGIAVEIPIGFVGLIYARSGLACKRGVAPANKVGVVDSDYRGEVIVALYNHSNQEVCIEDGERIAQMVVTPYVFMEYEEVESLGDTKRGVDGFGSTGMK